MSHLLLVRHGNTKLNSAERFWGQTDVELNDAGVEQAQHLRDRLADQKIAAIYASDLKRAVRTAEIIACAHEVKIATCAELREINFGHVEGLTFEEIKQRYPELTESWLSWSLSMRFPGGESVDELDTRVRRFLTHLEKHNDDEVVLIVAHSASLRLLVCHLLGVDPQHWRQFRLDLASLSILDTYPQGAILNLLNDISHLDRR